MADSTVTIKVNDFPTGKSMLQTNEEYYGTFTVVAGNYVANGLPLVWTSMTGVTSGNKVLPISTATKPFYANVVGIGGYIYAFDAAHNTLRVFVTGTSPSALGELVAGAAVPATVVSDTISFRAIFSKD